LAHPPPQTPIIELENQKEMAAANHAAAFLFPGQ
jgi:hypothetical protein